MITLVAASFAIAKLTFIPLASGCTEADVSGISSDGKVVVGTMNGKDKKVAFIWDEKSGTRELGDLSWNMWRIGGGITEFDETGNPIDRVGVAASKMRWARSVALLDPPKADLGPFKTPWFFGQSADGKVFFGNGISKEGAEGFLWSKAGGAIGIGDLPGGFFYSQLINISPEGNFAVGCSKSFDGVTAALWNKATGLVALEMEDGVPLLSQALCCSSGAKTIGGEIQTSNGLEAALWSKGTKGVTLRKLLGAQKYTEWQFSSCSCVADDGSAVAGAATDKAGNSHVWIARIVSQ